MRTFNIYSLSNFQVCNTVWLTAVTTPYIKSPELVYLRTSSLYLRTSIPFRLPQASGNHPSILWSYKLSWDSSCKWYYSESEFLGLMSLNLMPSRFIPIVAGKNEITVSKRYQLPAVHCSILLKTWKQPECPVMDEWLKKMWCGYVKKYYPAIKRERNPSIIFQNVQLCQVGQGQSPLLMRWASC